VLENVGSEDDVDRLAGDIDHAAANRPEDEVERNREPHSDRQGNQRRKRAIGDDAVVDAHGEEGRRQREHIYQEGCKRDVAVAAPMQLDHRPEPMASRQIACSDGACVALDRRPDEECVSGVVGRDGLDRVKLGETGRQGRIEDFDIASGFVEFQQDQRRPILHDKDGRQHQRGDIGNVAFDGFGLEARALSCTVIEGN